MVDQYTACILVILVAIGVYGSGWVRGYSSASKNQEKRFKEGYNMGLEHGKEQGKYERQ